MKSCQFSAFMNNPNLFGVKFYIVSINDFCRLDEDEKNSLKKQNFEVSFCHDMLA